ncbi:MAG: protein translocase subunit SecD, partial [Pseudomonadota bacterium]|nr:protein translocase subunit SecD [Pseudomonadota bacterium]
ISGNFTPSEAKDLALLLRAGALPVPLDVMEERTVGPDLGSDAIEMGVTTGLIGAALVFAFMITLYRRWGLIACTSLAINIGLIIGLLSAFGATLTLPGIAGIILTIGMAVDANILINERIKEESAKGKAAGLAIPAGFDKAYATILDSSFTTLIAVSLLFMFGSGPVKGFAITIGIGIFTSIFTAVAVTRQMMGWATRNRSRQVLTFGNNWLNQSGLSRINFMRGRVVGLVASAILSIGSVILFVQPGLHYGVDFTGGTLIEMQSSTLSVEQVRDTLAEHQIEGASIQEFGEPGNYLIRVSQQNSDAGNTVNLVKNAISAKDSAASYPKVDMVGAKVSGGFADASILAVLIAGGGILLYLWLRFEQHFALAATAT